MTKSVFCRSVTGEGQCLAVGGKCRFAHTIEELRPRLCRYGDRCNRHKDHPKTCKFVHPEETIYDYAITHGFQKWPSPPSKLDASNRSISFDFNKEEFPQLSSPLLEGLGSFETVDLDHTMSPLSLRDLEEDMDMEFDSFIQQETRKVTFDKVVRWNAPDSNGIAILSGGV
jgi:hypothetical protein